MRATNGGDRRRLTTDPECVCVCSRITDARCGHLLILSLHFYVSFSIENNNFFEQIDFFALRTVRSTPTVLSATTTPEDQQLIIIMVINVVHRACTLGKLYHFINYKQLKERASIKCCCTVLKTSL